MADPLTLVQNAYGAFGRGDIPALLQMLTDDVRWQFVGDRNAPYTATVVGHGQVGEWFGSVAASDDIQAFEPRQFLAGANHVTVIGWERSIAKPSGKPFECEWVHVWRIRDGRISSFWGMYDTAPVAAARA
ncbi:MAG: nuclear transport factor 2 family protein [Rhizobacter sp.]|nr:nuclear transport factor 2 family protein [Rhizobacter sp.]